MPHAPPRAPRRVRRTRHAARADGRPHQHQGRRPVRACAQWHRDPLPGRGPGLRKPGARRTRAVTPARTGHPRLARTGPRPGRTRSPLPRSATRCGQAHGAPRPAAPRMQAGDAGFPARAHEPGPPRRLVRVLVSQAREARRTAGRDCAPRSLAPDQLRAGQPQPPARGAPCPRGPLTRSSRRLAADYLPWFLLRRHGRLKARVAAGRVAAAAWRPARSCLAVGGRQARAADRPGALLAALGQPRGRAACPGLCPRRDRDGCSQHQKQRQQAGLPAPRLRAAASRAPRALPRGPATRCPASGPESPGSRGRPRAGLMRARKPPTAPPTAGTALAR